MLTRVSAQRYVEHEEVPVNWSILISAMHRKLTIIRNDCVDFRVCSRTCAFLICTKLATNNISG